MKRRVRKLTTFFFLFTIVTEDMNKGSTEQEIVSADIEKPVTGNELNEMEVKT